MALPLDLPLQRPRVGRNPDRRPIGLGPQRGRREIAQGLADPRAGFSEHKPGLALARARQESEGGRGGEVGLGRTRFVQARAGQKLREPVPRQVRVDRLGARLARRRLVLPFLQPGPDVETGAAPGPAHWLQPQRLNGQRAPGPAGPRQGLRNGQRLLAAWPGRSGELRQQGLRRQPQRRGLGFDRTGFGLSQRDGEAGRRRGAELRRPDECVELEHVEQIAGAGGSAQAQAPGRQAGLTEQRHAVSIAHGAWLAVEVECERRPAPRRASASPRRGRSPAPLSVPASPPAPTGNRRLRLWSTRRRGSGSPGQSSACSSDPEQDRPLSRKWSHARA